MHGINEQIDTERYVNDDVRYEVVVPRRASVGDSCTGYQIVLGTVNPMRRKRLSYLVMRLAFRKCTCVTAVRR